MEAAALPLEPTIDDRSASQIALAAARSASPFASHVAGQVRAIVAGVRRGDDAAAMGALAEIMSELESFLSFFILVEDLLEPRRPEVAAYRRRLTRAIEGTAPALAHQDLVEVADSLSEDLLPLLEGYAEIDVVISSALEPPTHRDTP